MNPILPLNTAVFWDIENLIGGYSFNQTRPQELSLEEIFKLVKASPGVQGIAVQRAYANWSDHRLAVLRTELNENGIEPVQVFGFSYDQKKNAADIQLVIDALELVHLRESISTYVIVSGDGGFSALVRMLHQHSRYVVCVAYADSVNATLKKICDHFEPLKKPTRGVAAAAGPLIQHSPPIPAHTGQVPFAQGLTQLKPTAALEDISAGIQKVLKNVASDREYSKQLKAEGLSLPQIQPAIGWLLERVTMEKALARCGVPALGKLILAFTDDKLFLARSTGELRLFSKEAQLGEKWIRQTAVPLEPHTPLNYRALLSSERTAPAIRLADSPRQTLRALQGFLDKSWRGQVYSEVLSRIAEGDGTERGRIPIAQVQRIGDSLRELGQMKLEGAAETAPTDHIYQGLPSEDWESLLELLRAEAVKKLEVLLGQSPHTTILYQLLPEALAERAAAGQD